VIDYADGAETVAKSETCKTGRAAGFGAGAVREPLREVMVTAMPLFFLIVFRIGL